VRSELRNEAGDVGTLLDGGGDWTGDDDASSLVLMVPWFPRTEPPNLMLSKWL